MSCDGLNIADFDLLFHRYRWSNDRLGGRGIEHLMVVEIKKGAENLRHNQRDSFSLFAGFLDTMIPVNGEPIGVESRPGFIYPGEKKIIWHGVHLVRVPFEKNNLGPFQFDNRSVTSDQLIGLLNFELDSRGTRFLRRLDIDRRHKSPSLEAVTPGLFQVSA